MSQTFEAFFNNYVSPYETWALRAKAADAKDPGDDKIRQGWTIEKPSHSTMNYWQKRTDTRLKKLEAKIEWLESQLAGN